jgi:glutaredoxin 3
VSKNPNQETPPVEIYTRLFCGYCTAALQLLNQSGVPFQEIKTDGKPELRADIARRSGQHTVPQIFVRGHSVGGYTELSAAMRNGQFQALLDQQG